MHKLLIADDHHMSATGTIRLLWEEWPDIALATSIDRAIEMLDARPVDLLLLDVMFRNDTYRGGFTILRHVVAHHPTTRVLLVTGFDDPLTARNAKNQGAHGCFGKHTNPEQLPDAVRTVLGGGEWWGGLLDPPTLTRRQHEVLILTAQGHRQQEIATLLGITLVTVETHLDQVRSRFGTYTTAQAVSLAERMGIIIPDIYPQSPANQAHQRDAGREGGREGGREASDVAGSA